MKILVTGADGYIGWPLFLKLIYEKPNYKIIGIDNFYRRKIVSKYSKGNTTKIFSMKERMKELKRKGKNFKFHKIDLLDKFKVYGIVKKYKPDVILHLAAQPLSSFCK